MANGTRRTRQRPRRHEAVMPGTEGGIGSGGQDKNEPGARTPAGRALGLDDRDIPGAQPHLVNPEVPHTKATPKDPGPMFDGMQAHGVPDEHHEDGYRKPSDEVTHAPRPLPVPDTVDAVPVRIVEGKKERVIRIAALDSISVPASTAAEPVRVCNVDPNRVRIGLLNEDQVNDFRVGTRSDLINAKGALISHFTNSYTWLETQDELFALGASTSKCLLSVIIETEILAG